MYRVEANFEGNMEGVNRGFHENRLPNVFMSATVPFSPLNSSSGCFSPQFDAMGDCSASSASQSFMTAAFDGAMHQNMMNPVGSDMGYELFNQPNDERLFNVPYDVGLCESFLRMNVGDQQRGYCNTSKTGVNPDELWGGFNDPLSNRVGPVCRVGHSNQPAYDYPMGWGQRWDVQDSMGSSPFLRRSHSNALYSEDQVDYYNTRLVKEQERGYWSQGVQQQRPLMVNDRPCLNDGFLNYSNIQQCGILADAGVNSSQMSELDLAYRLQMLKQQTKAVSNPGVNIGAPALPMTNAGPVGAFNGEGSLVIDATRQCSKCLAEKKSKRSKAQKRNSRNDRSTMTMVSENDLVLDDQLQYLEACESGSMLSQLGLGGISGKGSTLGIPIPSATLLNYKSLLDLQGHIYSMSKHQLGCRLLQKIFDEGSDRDIDIVFTEIIDHVVELAVDPFGNYLIQKLLDVCTEQQKILVVLMVTKQRGELINICLDSHGTRVVQKLIETIKSKPHITMITLALKPDLLELINDLNGNHVVQRCLQCLSNEHNKFIYDTAANFCLDIATHQNGCCVLNRCIGYSSGKHREKLVSSICANGLLLAQDAFGNYVIQYIIELKIPSAASTLVSLFEGHFAYLSMQKFSSHVVEKCLRFIEASHPKIIQDLISVPRFDMLLQDRFANYVIQSALEATKGSSRALLVEAIRPYEVLRTSPYCKKIFSRILLKK